MARRIAAREIVTMRYQCVSADRAAIRVRDVETGYGWCFNLVEQDGRLSLEAEDFEEFGVARRPASFTVLAGAYMFALREARQRGLIDR